MRNNSIRTKTIYTAGICIFLLLFSSCNQDILDIENPAAIGVEQTWNSENATNAYLANLYARVMPGGWPSSSGAQFNGLSTDESVGVFNENTVTISSHAWAGSFENAYTSIRQINILLEGIDNGSNSEAVKASVKGQAYFLRAYTYFLLLRVYGGVPVILEAQSQDEDLEVSRNTSLEVFDQIYADLDLSIDLLNGQAFAEDDKGRIGEAAAVALKGRVALYKASPLFNPNNPYGNSYWQEAYTLTNAAKERLDELDFGLIDNYGSIWDLNNEGNAEAVLTVKLTAPNKTGRNSSTPVWSLVDAYLMKDGLPKDQSSYTYDEQTFWQNRDSRLDATIVYHASIYELYGVSGRRQYVDPDLGVATLIYSTDVNTGGVTGISVRKGTQPQLPREDVSQAEIDWIEIRYAEVLLNFAEAANEIGNLAEAKEAVRQLRIRAGIEAGTADYGLDIATDADTMRDLILNERMIELAFEGKRFWDLKRHRRLSILDNTIEQGVSAKLKDEFFPIDETKKENFGYLPEDFEYTVGTRFKTIATDVTFQVPDNIDFAPIPNAQLQKNPKLEQTNIWGGSFNPTLE